MEVNETDEKPSKPEKVKSEPVSSDSPVTTPGKSHKYKQCYRAEWESMPDFKGWLRGIPNEPTRAYCRYCEKSLHAHRLSLLKHTCTLRHTKAAQTAYSLQMSKKDGAGDGKGVIPPPTPPPIKAANHSTTEEDGEEDEDEESVDDVDPMDDEGSGDSPPASKIAKMDMPAPPVPASPSSPLSTHVLDMAKGNPVSGLQVTLYRLIDGRWTLIHEGFTNPDGRYTEFIKKADFVAGRYKLHFDVDRYFELRRQDSLYPFIEVVFDVKSPQDHYHVPLLLSPYGYTTYRGS